MTTKTSDQHDAKEVARRRDETLKRMIATPPSRHKDGVRKSPDAPKPGRPKSGR